MAEEDSKSVIGGVMKWIGIIAGLISFCGTLYGVMHSTSELRDHKRVFGEQLKSGQAQQSAGDYAGAWDSFTHAEATVAEEGVFSKLLGGLSAEQREARTAEQDLAMEWLRSSRVPEGTQFSSIADKLVNVLTIGASGSSGARKADLLAHLGWAYFLKQRDGEAGLHPDSEYQQAIAADAKNPYANAFWGHFILWNRGSLKEADQKFAAALSSDRARDVVRHFQLTALNNVRSNDSEAAYLSVVSDMLAAKEPIESRVREEVCDIYTQALGDSALLQAIGVALTPPREVDFLGTMRQAEELSQTQKTTLNVALAMVLEDAGRSAEALDHWKQLSADLKSQPNSVFIPRINAAIKRLSSKK
jgi:hypothetical protein